MEKLDIHIHTRLPEYSGQGALKATGVKEMMEYLKVRYLSEKGQGIVEYALLLVFVVGIAVVVLNTDLTTSIKAAFTKVTSNLN